MKKSYKHYPDFLGNNHPDLCGFSEELNPEWSGFSSCNLMYGCGYCRVESDYVCSACGESTGWVNDVGGMTFSCGGPMNCQDRE